MLRGSKTTHGTITSPRPRVTSNREQGQKPNHCKVAPLTFQGQDNKCENNKIPGSGIFAAQDAVFLQSLVF
jgi:hypothetical protein